MKNAAQLFTGTAAAGSCSNKGGRRTFNKYGNVINIARLVMRWIKYEVEREAGKRILDANFARGPVLLAGGEGD